VRGLFVLLALGSLALAQTPEEVAGDWQGAIELPGNRLEIGITFELARTGLAGTIDIPAQGAEALPLENVRLDGNRLTFAIQGVPGEPTFTGTLRGNVIAGDFTQSGATFPFTLERGTLEVARPQEPEPPFPYREEEVSYQNGEVTLSGTLTLPKGEGPFAAVLLITGSGAQDRDETIAGHKPFLVLADRLTRAGYAVLRTDDRGVGGSTGNLAQATYDDLVGDVLAGVTFLKQRPEIDPGRIGLLGHSEGGYLAPLAANHSEDVAFVILMAAPAVPGLEVLLLQNRLLFERAGAPREAVQAQLAYLRRLTRLLEQHDYVAARDLIRERIEGEFAALPEAQRPSAAEQEALIEAQVAGAATPNFRSFVLYDPRPTLERLDIPVLAFYGGKDLQVPAQQSVRSLRAALADNPDATVRVFGNLNHLMQPARTGAPEEYAQIETTIAPQVLDLVVGWLEARYERAPSRSLSRFDLALVAEIGEK